MFETFAHWLHNDTFEFVYVGVLLALTLLPPTLLARWYHRNISKTEDGRRLMEHQKAWGVGPRSLGDSGSLSLLRDIAGGRYGEEVKRIHNRMYVVVLVWFVSASLFAGLMVAAQLIYP